MRVQYILNLLLRIVTVSVEAVAIAVDRVLRLPQWVELGDGVECEKIETPERVLKLEAYLESKDLTAYNAM